MTTTQTGRDGFLIIHDSNTGKISISYDTPLDEEYIVLTEKSAKILNELLGTLLTFLEIQRKL